MGQFTFREFEEKDFSQAVELYRDAGWVNYTDNLPLLQNAFCHSIKIYGAYDVGRLIGLVRAVGDGYSILYIQDILVLTDYRRQGIGRRLLNRMLEEYPMAYQTVLLTDNRPDTAAFYQNAGFQPAAEWNCGAFVKFRS